MNRWVLKSGAIASSTVAVCSYINASAIGIAQPDAESAVSPQPPELTPSEQSQQAHPSDQITPTIQSAPDAFLLDALGIESRGLPSTIEKTYSHLLSQAQTLASRDHFTEALATAAGIPKNSQSYNLAQQLQEDWSQELLQRAVGNCQKGQMTAAIAMLNIIPAESEQYSRAIELRARWQRQASVLNQAIVARNSADWQKVADSLKLIEGTQLYQSAPVQTLLQQSIQNLYSPDQSLLGLASQPELEQIQQTGNFSTVPIRSSTPTIASSQNEATPLPMDLGQAIALAHPAPVDSSLPQFSKQSNFPFYSSKNAPSAPSQIPIQISKRIAPPDQEPSIASPLNKLSMRSPEIMQLESSDRR
jgi:hypothetical protein